MTDPLWYRVTRAYYRLVWTAPQGVTVVLSREEDGDRKIGHVVFCIDHNIRLGPFKDKFRTGTCTIVAKLDHDDDYLIDLVSRGIVVAGQRCGVEVRVRKIP